MVENLQNKNLKENKIKIVNESRDEKKKYGIDHIWDNQKKKKDVGLVLYEFG